MSGLLWNDGTYYKKVGTWKDFSNNIVRLYLNCSFLLIWFPLFSLSNNGECNLIRKFSSKRFFFSL